MDIAIETSDLSRTYQTYKKSEGLIHSIKGLWNREYESKTALQSTSLQIESGQIVGLVGANGAGKTTLIKMLCGLIHPSSGKARVLGYEPFRRQNEFLKRISVLLGQKNQLWWDLPPVDSFHLLGKIYEIPKDELLRRFMHLAEILNCKDQLKTQLRRLSLGERMKMEIIGSLLHRPEVLFLDEPTIGLDIVAQSTIREFLKEYVLEFKPTIILTSHYMDDISKLAHRLLLISSGQMVYDGTVQEFTQQAEIKQKIIIKIDSPLKENLVLNDELSISSGQDVIEVETRKEEVGRIIERITRSYQIEDLKIEETGFEDVIHKFLQKDHRNSSTRNPHAT